MSAHSTVDISLQGREYRVTCPPEERESLLAAVTCVDSRMKELAEKTRSAGERLAVMTALNLAHDLLGAASGTAAKMPAREPAKEIDRDDFARRIGLMVARLDTAMAQQDNLF